MVPPVIIGHIYVELLYQITSWLVGQSMGYLFWWDPIKRQEGGPEERRGPSLVEERPPIQDPFVSHYPFKKDRM